MFVILTMFPNTRVTIKHTSWVSMNFDIGQRFNSFQQLQQFVDQFKKSNLFNLTRRDSKSFELAIKTKPKWLEGANKQLRFYYLKLCCNFGGKEYKKRKISTEKPRSTKYDTNL